MLASVARWALAHRATLAAALLGLEAAGCHAGTGPFRPRVTSGPPERDIPLRIVKLVHCQGCTQCSASCRETPRLDEVALSVASANETFAEAGLRFVVPGVERVEAPSFWRHGVRDVTRTWGEIREEAQRVFPWMTEPTWSNPGEVKTTERWLEVLTAVFARPREVTIFVQYGGGNRGETHFPNGGRGIWAMDGLFGIGPGGGNDARRDSQYLLGHELGHFFGLRHTWTHAGINPDGAKPWRLADRWDLVYRPGSSPEDPHVFFNSREEAYRYSDRELRMIEQMGEGGSSCRESRDGSIACVLPGKNGYSETHRSGDDALKGLSFPLEEGGRYRFARNAAAYGDMAIPRRLSASQIEMVQAFLHEPLMIGPVAMDRWGRLPDGIAKLPSYRHTLGLPE